MSKPETVITDNACLSAGKSLGIMVMFLATSSFAPVSAATFTTLYSFTGGSGVGVPYSGVVFGANGSLYGTTATPATLYTVWNRFRV
jgi:hypothetical protein